MELTLDWGSDFTLLLLVVFFAATALMDFGMPWTWLKPLRGVAAVLLAVSALAALL